MYERPFKFVYQEKKNNKLTNSRLGIVVSKKYSKSAVKRNQAKRVLREIFRVSSLRSYNIDLVVILSKPIDVASVNSDIKKFIREKFKKIEGRIIWAQNKKEH
jgi:ribonuclease P protein component